VDDNPADHRDALSVNDLVFGDGILEGPTHQLERPRLRTLRIAAKELKIATKNAKTAKGEGPNVSLDVRWLDTHREEKRIIATKNAKIAKKGRAKCFFRCPVVRGLTTPQKRTVE
jgi:hypothetical protein